MRCQYCGSEMASGISSCPNCGGSVASSTTPPPPTGAPVVPTRSNSPFQQMQQPAAPQQQKKRKWLIVVGIIFVLLVIGSISTCIGGGTKMTAVPDVVGMKPSDAESTITSSYTGSMKWAVVFTINGESTSSSASELEEQGYVVDSQNPLPAETYPKNETLKITLDLKVSADFVPADEPLAEEAAQPEPASVAPANTEDELYKTMSIDEYAAYLQGDKTIEDTIWEYINSDVWLCAVRPSYGAEYAGFDESLMKEYNLTWLDVANEIAINYLNEKDLAETTDNDLERETMQKDIQLFELLWSDIQQNLGYTN